MRTIHTAALPVAAWLWLAFLVAAPLTLSRGEIPVATMAMYRSAALLCHQKTERSFAVAHAQMPVCARCFGLYAAGALGALAHLATGRHRRTPPPAAETRALLAVAALPIVLSVGLEWLGAIPGSNVSRVLSALPLGAVAGWLLQQLVATGEPRLVSSYG
jgi:uncharacterized membrane protein